MRLRIEVEAELEVLREHCRVLAAYAAHSMDRKDKHGVRDAMTDIEATESAIAALEWALGSRRHIGR